MARATLEERVAALERQVGALLADHSGTRRAKDWRRTRGVFTGDDLMKQVFKEGRKIPTSCTGTFSWLTIKTARRVVA